MPRALVLEGTRRLSLRELSMESLLQMAKASVACGADGLIIEVHPRPEEALSDGPQSLKPSKFAQLMRELRPVAEAVGRAL